MKSNIKFINDEKDSRVRKETIESIKERFSNNNYKYYHPISLYYDLLIYSKYIIERDNLNVSNIIEGDIDELFDKLNKENISKDPTYSYLIKKFIDNKLYELLKKVIYEDYEIVKYNDRVVNSIIDSDNKVLIVSDDNINIVDNSKIDLFIYDSIPLKVDLKYRMYNQILNINNNIYISGEDIDYKIYDKVIFISSKHDMNSAKQALKHYYYDIKKLYMICNYSDVSKYQESFLNIKTIMMNKDKVYIEYKILDELKRPDDEDIKVCIKELTNVSDEELLNVIKSDKEKDNICVYASLKDIRNNSHRLGFKAYNRKFDLDRTRVLRLIDYNEKITRDIEKLNKEISNQIDQIIVR